MNFLFIVRYYYECYVLNIYVSLKIIPKICQPIRAPGRLSLSEIAHSELRTSALIFGTAHFMVTAPAELKSRNWSQLYGNISRLIFELLI